jgi:uncharacterized protein YegJ (DUF2314 family)
MHQHCFVALVCAQNGVYHIPERRRLSEIFFSAEQGAVLTFSDFIGNEPLSVKNVKIDQQVGIPFEKVSDWMIIEDGRLIGGYTIRAIR